MAKEKSKVPAPVTTKSDALQTLEANLDQIMAFIRQMAPDGIVRAGKRFEQTIAKETQSLPNINVKRLERGTKAVGRLIDKWVAFYVPAARWVIVMLVSFLESYLEDVLVGIAVKNPPVVKNVQVQTERVFEVASIEELRSDLRRNWAHDALRPNGPITWHRTLRGLGAPKFEQPALKNIQYLWDTRNLIVHARCIADNAYAKKYTDRGAKAGVEVKVNLHSLGEWLHSVKILVDWADAFYLRYGAKSGKRQKA